VCKAALGVSAFNGLSVITRIFLSILMPPFFCNLFAAVHSFRVHKLKGQDVM
jgi:hypothetical protein